METTNSNTAIIAIWNFFKEFYVLIFGMPLIFILFISWKLVVIAETFLAILFIIFFLLSRPKTKGSNNQFDVKKTTDTVKIWLETFYIVLAILIAIAMFSWPFSVLITIFMAAILIILGLYFGFFITMNRLPGLVQMIVILLIIFTFFVALYDLITKTEVTWIKILAGFVLFISLIAKPVASWKDNPKELQQENKEAEELNLREKKWEEDISKKVNEAWKKINNGEELTPKTDN